MKRARRRPGFRQNRQRWAALPLLLLLTLSASGCTHFGDTPVERQFYAMDAVMDLTVYGSRVEDAVEATVKRVGEIEALSSSYLSGSDVSKSNAEAGKSAVAVSPETLKMVQTAVRYENVTDGAFDITVGPLISLWGIGTDRERVPSQAEIDRAFTLVGSDKIQINEAQRSVMLTQFGMSIDLGGIAKGFAADEILRIFQKYGIQSALINLGSSSIYALGNKPDGSPGTVAIRHPRDEGAYLCVVRLTDRALSTSGDYERYLCRTENATTISSTRPPAFPRTRES